VIPARVSKPTTRASWCDGWLTRVSAWSAAGVLDRVRRTVVVVPAVVRRRNPVPWTMELLVGAIVRHCLAPVNKLHSTLTNRVGRAVAGAWMDMISAAATSVAEQHGLLVLGTALPEARARDLVRACVQQGHHAAAQRLQEQRLLLGCCHHQLALDQPTGLL